MLVLEAWCISWAWTDSTCGCLQLGFLSDRQLHKLHMLAHLKLVAICHLQHAIITLVPYYNAQNGFKVVGFMLADD